MPVIDVQKSTIEKIVGKKLSIEQIEDAMFRFGVELDGVEGQTLKIEVTPERVDLMTPEGIARALRAYLGIKKGFPFYEVKKTPHVLKVENNLKGVREFAVCAIIRGLKWTDEMIKEFMNSCSKIDQTYGRNRKKTGQGIYPIENVNFPIKYYGEEPKNIKYIPLGMESEMTADDILKGHPKGVENSHIMVDWKVYPVFKDKKGKILSMPPIVNSKETGEVTPESKDIFLEVTGTNWRAVNEVLNVLVTSLAERGGKIYSVTIKMGGKTFVTPDLKPRKQRIKIEFINNIFGLNLTGKEIKNLLERMLYGAEVRGKEIEVTVPAFRTDILHNLDIADDVGRAYGFDNMKPEIPAIATMGGMNNKEKLTQKIRETMIGLGFLEEMSLVLTSKEDQFEKMNVIEEEVAEVSNSKALGCNITRKYLLPELMKCLTYNMHRSLPQKIFEVGDVVVLDKNEIGAKNVRKLSALITSKEVGYEEISSTLSSLMNNFNIKLELSKFSHPSFIEGRCAKISYKGKEIGVIGEVNPQVIQNWKLENPIVAFEITLEEIFISDK